jgi:hypothetical protein
LNVSAAIDFDDVGDLHHVEQCGDPRHDVLAVGRGRRHKRVVAVGKRHDQRCHRLGQLLVERGVVGEQHLGDAVELGCRVGRGLGVLAGNQHVDVAADLPCGG